MTPTKTAGSGKILVVDDDEDFRFALASTFERLGYEVEVAGNGHQALDLIWKNAFQIVVSDIRMPNGDGIELLEKTRTSIENVPVVLLLTGFADITTKEAYEKGATALFSKPLDSKKLMDVVQRLMNSAPANVQKITRQARPRLTAELFTFDTTTPIRGKVLDFSAGGMYLALPNEKCPNVNDEMRFKIRLDNQNRIYGGDGIIRWANIQATPSLPTGCELEFLHLPDRDRQELLAYLNP